MIDALKIAAGGMLKAERRATDIAQEILKATGEAASFTLEDSPEQGTQKPASGAPVAAPGGGVGYSDLLQQMVDLKAEEHAFKANARVFQRVDETLGSLLDDKG
ncbi:hypothetical protein [Kordiimonas gwangyangensis]|uniref:hypothetical protein n=1 Tax=Kordiimonas gwangyangensis TaxID=288022 RepID=UPI000372217D|nr:hypothetical protein [Kordiimonas gwangyangensis]